MNHPKLLAEALKI